MKQARKEWKPSHTAEMAVLRGRGWTNSRIARKLGFSRKTVQERSDAIGLDNCWRARSVPYIALDFQGGNFPI